MNEEFATLLKKNLEVSEQSLKILKKIHKDILWRRIFNLVKWGIIIAISIWSYLQLQPVLQSLLENYQKLLSSPTGQFSGINLNTLPPEAQKLLEGILNKK